MQRKLRWGLALGLLLAVASPLVAHGHPSPLDSASLSAPSPAPPRARAIPQTASAEGARGKAPSTASATGDVEAGPGGRVKFEHLSIEHGLSQSSVNAILQDSEGFIWFGTNDGLNRYDGYDFTIYRADPDDVHSLSHDAITALIEDRERTLWVGTRDGLNRFDRETERFTPYETDPENADSPVDGEITSLCEDQSGALWIGTREGLHRFDRETGRFTHYRADPDDPHGLPDDEILSIYEDRSGTLWVGTRSGLARLERETGRFTHYQLVSQDATGLGHNAVQAIVEDGAGGLWIGTGGSGFHRFRREAGASRQYLINPRDVGGFSYNDVRSICEDQAGALWIGTDGGGLYRFDREKETLTPYREDPHEADSLSSNYVNAIYEGQAGLLWIGTGGGGVNKLDRGKEKFVLYQADPNDPSSLSQNRVLALFEDEAGMLWIGTDGGGLDQFDREQGTFTHYRHDPDDGRSLINNYVTSIYADREGDLWLGTWGGGVDRLDRQSGRFVHYQADPYDPYSLSSNVVLAVHRDQEGSIWIGTDSGLEKFDPGTRQFVHYRGLSGGVRSIYQDRDDVLWFGTGEGLVKFDRQDGRTIRYQINPGQSDSPSHGEVNAIHQDRQGTLWIGTDGGLNRFDPATETFIHYGEEDGLSNDVVQGILEDDQGCLWLSTIEGLSKFDPSTGTFKSYDVSDGLQGYEFTRAHWKSEDGEMFFGGVNGLNAFHPERVRDNPFVPPIVLSSLTQGGKEIDVGRAAESLGEVTFRWPNNSFEFEIAALNYRQPERNQYAYRLEGFDRGWNDIGTRRFGRYTNLPGGTYTLWIKGSNNDGVWNEQGASLEVTIVPPFWATWWFRGLALLALVTGAVGGYRLRVRRIAARSRELESLVTERTTALSRTNVRLKQEIAERKRAEEALARQAAETAVIAERNRLARDLHDAVTQTLFSASLIAEALPDIWKSDQEEGRELLGEIRRLSRGALAEMRTLLLELRPAALTETSLGDLMRQLAEAASGREDVDVTVEIEDGWSAAADDQPCALPTDVHVAFYRIAQEALNNVIQHARASHVTIGLRSTIAAAGERGERVILRVRDDGCGFDPSCVPPDRMGLSIIRERAQSVGATLEIESGPARGTDLSVIWSADEGQATDDRLSSEEGRRTR